MELYPRQAEVMQTCLNALNHPTKYNHGRIILAGETGVGKTYITSALLKHFKSVIVYCPSSVFKKWQRVIKGFDARKLGVFSTSKNFDQETFNQAPIKLVRYSQKNQFTSCFKGPVDLVVIDEYSQIKYNKDLYDFVEQGQRCLLLSGTPFNMKHGVNVDSLIGLYPELVYSYYWKFRLALYYAGDQQMRFMKMLAYIWRFVAVTINLDEVKINQDDVKQQLSIYQLALSPEQRAYYQLLSRQMSENEVINYLDQMDQSPVYEYRRQKSLLFKDGKKVLEPVKGMHQKGKMLLSFLLKPIQLKDTEKYRHLKQLVGKTGNKLVFVRQDGLRKRLADLLTNDGLTVKVVPKSISKGDLESWINQHIDDYDALLINPSRIVYGIDLTTVDMIVWYQLLDKLDEVIQTNRRAYRLSSTKDSTVYFLVYGNTTQDDQLQTLANNYAANAIASGHQEDDPLAKLSDIVNRELG